MADSPFPTKIDIDLFSHLVYTESKKRVGGAGGHLRRLYVQSRTSLALGTVKGGRFPSFSRRGRGG